MKKGLITAQTVLKANVSSNRSAPSPSRSSQATGGLQKSSLQPKTNSKEPRGIWKRSGPSIFDWDFVADATISADKTTGAKNTAISKPPPPKLSLEGFSKEMLAPKPTKIMNKKGETIALRSPGGTRRPVAKTASKTGMKPRPIPKSYRDRTKIPATTKKPPKFDEHPDSSVPVEKPTKPKKPIWARRSSVKKTQKSRLQLK